MAPNELCICGDPNELAAIHAACFPEAPWDEAAFASLLSGPGVLALTIAAPDGASGLAVLRVIGTECEIISLGISPGYRRAGRGGALLTGALARAWALGARSFFLEVAEDNEAALRLYRGLGFLRIDQRKNYYRRANSRFCDALVLRLEPAEMQAVE